MEIYGKIRCVTYAELVTSGIITASAYKKKVRAGKIIVVQRGGNGRRALIDYNSLPTAIRHAYDRHFPNAVAEMKERLVSYTVRPDAAAIEFYKTYQPPISLERQAEYVLNAEVLNEMLRIENETAALHKKCRYSTSTTAGRRSAG